MKSKKIYLIKGFIRKLPSHWEADIPLLGVHTKSYCADSALVLAKIEIIAQFQFSDLDLDCDNGEIYMRFPYNLPFLEKVRSRIAQHSGASEEYLLHEEEII